MAAAALSTVAVSAVMLWWTRRPARTPGAPRTLGAPRPLEAPRYSRLLIAAVVLLGIALPFFGISLAIVSIVERTILRRIPASRAFLGLA